VRLIRDPAEITDELRGGAITIGNFDGVHVGHAKIIGRLLERASQVGGPAVVFTFDPHPARLLYPEKAPPPLTWIERKADLLADLGAEAVIAYPTDEAFLRLGPREFFDRIVCEKLAARVIVEGPNFFFGRNRKGTIGILRRFCVSAGVNLEVVEPIKVGGEYVSSSRIRRLIEAGQVEEAAPMLTQPYRIRGMVIHGAGRGRKLGFPTANLGAVETLLPRDGIYAGRAPVDDRLYPAAISLGSNPTFGEHVRKVEVFVLDFDASLYGRPLEVDFLARLRDIHTYASVDELVSQLGRDVAQTRRVFEQNAHRPALPVSEPGPP